MNSRWFSFQTPMPNIFIPSAANPVLIDFTNGTQVSVDAGSGASQICVEMTVNSTEDTIADRVIMVNYTMRDGSATGMFDLYIQAITSFVMGLIYVEPHQAAIGWASQMAHSKSCLRLSLSLSLSLTHTHTNTHILFPSFPILLFFEMQVVRTIQHSWAHFSSQTRPGSHASHSTSSLTQEPLKWRKTKPSMLSSKQVMQQ